MHLRILFANARPGVPYAFDGGAQRTVYDLILALYSRGHEVRQLSAFGGLSEQEARLHARQLGYEVTAHGVRGVPALHTRLSAAPSTEGVAHLAPEALCVDNSHFDVCCDRLIGSFRPQLLVTSLAGSDVVCRLGFAAHIPTVLRVLDPVNPKGLPPICPNTHVLANSPVAAQSSSARYSRDVPYVLEPVNHDMYRTERYSPRWVTYLNPQRDKGLYLFDRVARLCPDVGFQVCKGWSWSVPDPEEAATVADLAALPNVHLMGPEPDMKAVYRDTRVLLLPSRWPESWARVIGEAQASGIPVLASDRGCSPQYTGTGGVIIPYGAPEIWATVLKEVLSDQLRLRSLEADARENVRRFPFLETVVMLEEYFYGVVHGTMPFPAYGEPDVTIWRAEVRNGTVAFVRASVSMGARIDVDEPIWP